MERRWSTLVYRAARLLAGFIALMATAEVVYCIYTGQHEIPVVAFLLAGAIWLVGVFFLYTGRR